MTLMPHVSRPLIGLLVATVLFFGLWIVALQPGSSSPGGNQGLGRYQPAINAAKASVAAQNRAAAAANATSVDGTTSATAPSGAAATAATPTTPATSTTAATPATAATPTTSAQPATAAKPAAAASAPRATAATKTASRTRTAKPAAAPHVATPTERLNVVDQALKHHRVLALLFYNPAAADDQAVKQELRTIPTRRGRVVKLAIPVDEVASYPVVTNQVPIQGSPTLVIIDRSAQAFTLVGFSSAFEIAHRVDDALSMR